MIPYEDESFRDLEPMEPELVMPDQYTRKKKTSLLA